MLSKSDGEYKYVIFRRYVAPQGCPNGLINGAYVIEEVSSPNIRNWNGLSASSCDELVGKCISGIFEENPAVKVPGDVVSSLRDLGSSRVNGAYLEFPLESREFSHFVVNFERKKQELLGEEVPV